MGKDVKQTCKTCKKDKELYEFNHSKKNIKLSGGGYREWKKLRSECKTCEYQRLIERNGLPSRSKKDDPEKRRRELMRSLTPSLHPYLLKGLTETAKKKFSQTG